MNVSNIMRAGFVTADPGEPLESARQTMRMARLRHLLVTQDDQLVGLISYRELLERMLAKALDGTPGNGRKVADVMKLAPDFVTPETSLDDAADRLCRYGLGCLPVISAEPGTPLEEGRLVGIVTESDLLRAAYPRGESARAAGRGR
ncbi:MAG TPA: CBS domain-containing protein [Myxococcota bacterium]|nr:CBS domain-containing protein [Myxococcota bacterium]